jgi:hypothetical protein
MYTYPNRDLKELAERGDQGGSGSVLRSRMRALYREQCPISTFLGPGKHFHVKRNMSGTVQAMDSSRHDGRLGVCNDMHWSLFPATCGVPSCELTPMCVTTHFCCNHMQKQHVGGKHPFSLRWCSSILCGHASNIKPIMCT